MELESKTILDTGTPKENSANSEYETNDEQISDCQNENTQERLKASDDDSEERDEDALSTLTSTSTISENQDMDVAVDDDEKPTAHESLLDSNLKHFPEHLSDAGRFSYLGLCSTVLTLLYCDDFDK